MASSCYEALDFSRPCFRLLKIHTEPATSSRFRCELQSVHLKDFLLPTVQSTSSIDIDGKALMVNDNLLRLLSRLASLGKKQLRLSRLIQSVSTSATLMNGITRPRSCRESADHSDLAMDFFNGQPALRTAEELNARCRGWLQVPSRRCDGGGRGLGRDRPRSIIVMPPTSIGSSCHTSSKP